MKRIITLIVMLATMSFACFAKDGGVSRIELMTILNDYRGCEGLEILNVGSLGTSAIKSIVKASLKAEADEDAEEVIKLLGGIKKITIVDFEDCSGQIKAEMRQKIGKALGSSELLVEVRDNDGDSDTMKVYGVVNDSASTIKDFVMYDEQGCALICLFGTISMDAIANLSAK